MTVQPAALNQAMALRGVRGRAGTIGGPSSPNRDDRFALVPEIARAVRDAPSCAEI